MYLSESEIVYLDASIESHTDLARLTFLSKAIRSGLEIIGNAPQAVLEARS
jgi:hypothetical protein